MTRKVNRILAVVALGGACSVLGCKKKDAAPPPQSSPAPAVKRIAAVQQKNSSASIASASNNLLDFSNKKDPFKPFIEPVAEKPAASVRKRARVTEDLLPIQRYDISKFKVSGIIAGVSENTALVLDPSGKGYVIRAGMAIGNSEGHVNRITASGVEVVEPYRDDNGRAKKRTITLSLPRKR